MRGDVVAAIADDCDDDGSGFSRRLIDAVSV